ncbi:MAG TPA: CysB family HTH-type transcriptional regulator [Zoogloea sp.]|uniref:CysB family HTH-type transcriptional regulator n=1 Tax=Zoogloea sp. TaxID=49181 RepID=UPI002C83420C|nr:CysB family HTH-type transcriptional regulator [Zoogloea sp.]HMV16369.1 CysB family HTH-type transcriptional regulator [Rhodocyclaceae bacterium]HMW51405.1 CysB family HTH-type transcriptional regulator [Rhodocyclaceae bacterium]HMZ75809.1 CysB family HTH-type transcriptional regulator [Rhodocyclaceae bacterium]HNA66289.1 CysB family HTH-type transcriptional regulator [Rhodocyclaceae bacterium]HNB63081.1 CysB family HTH-type transcriptional regulator [Rhodocyclaceae bacterium]
MNFQQLRIIHETVRRNFNLTEVANALFTSQSGVSKHIKDLEDELGLELFVRKGKRLLGLTEPGRELSAVVDRMLMDARNIKSIAEQFSNKDHGQLTVATTHTQARYALPRVVTRFKQAYPRVHLMLHQASPGEIAAMLLDGRADIGIATEALAGVSDFVSFPYYGWHHAVIVPAGHALEAVTPLTLEAVAEHPLITYHEGFTGRAKIDETFAQAGFTPDIVMSALDADVIKTYVELGLGIGIVASMAYDAERDRALRMLPSDHLFGENVTRIAVRRGHFLRGFAYRFIELCAPELSEAVVRGALRPETGSDGPF